MAFFFGNTFEKRGDCSPKRPKLSGSPSRTCPRAPCSVLTSTLLAERDQIVVVEPGAPTLVRGVLRQHGLAQRVAHRGLPPGVGAPLAAQLADRIGPLLQGTVIPALDGGKAKAHRLAGAGMAPLARRKGRDLGAQLALGRRRRQQLSDDGEAQMRPSLVDSESCEAYIKSQAHEGWRFVRAQYDDGGLSGASLDRPALQQLLDHVGRGKIDVIVGYKVDRLTRSLADFAKLVELFDQHSVSFVSVTQSFNTTSSMGRLTLNVLLSFAQFEREVIRISMVSNR